MMVMWEHKELRVKEIGKCLFLDSSTLTPLLKRLEEKGCVVRNRSEQDERDLIVTLTDSGEALKERAFTIPERLGACVDLDLQKAQALYALLYEVLGKLGGYGYRKDPADHNRLVVDPAAAEIVKRIFALFEQGNGKLRIAKLLNREGIPCPSEYKRLNGERYHNGRRIRNTTYWTYATVNRILRNQMYIGNMEQGRAPRQTIHGRAKQLGREQWTVVEGTHEAIIDPEQWARVQSLLEKNSRTMNFEQNVSPFAGFLRCGDRGRAMSKTNHPAGVCYCCGSYKRYGPAVCSYHGISRRELEQIVLDDLNRIIAAVGDLWALAEQSVVKPKRRDLEAERSRVQGGLDRLYRLKKSAYEDYREGLIGKEDFLRCKADYERQEAQLTGQLELLREPAEEDFLRKPWVEALLRHGGLTGLDRATVAETVKQILIFENRRVEITYNFSDDLGILEGHSDLS